MKTTLLVSSVLALAAALGACAGDEPEQSSESALVPFSAGRSDMRIAVVGAGASGLTAAYTLKELGYTNVTVFEKEDHAGGKVNSLAVGNVRGELGAVFASPDYRTVLAIADKVGVPHVEYDTPRYVLNERNEKQTYPDYLTSHYTPAEIASAVASYAAVLTQFPEIEQDGFVGLHPDLYLTFDKFAAKYGFTPIAEMGRSLVVGFGYSYYETMPAIYALKLLPWLIKVGPNGLYAPPYYVFPTGYQSIWTELAKQLNVRLNAEVTRIERGNGTTPIRLTLKSGERNDFDAVIVSAPLSAVPKFVTLTPAEKALFAKVESTRYFVTLFNAIGMTGGETVFVHGNSKPSRINHLLAWGNPGGGVPIYIGYQIVDRNISSASVTAILALDVLTLAHALFTIAPIKKEWTDYFPRVSPATMSAGFFEDVDALQGGGGLFYVGSTLSFETVEHTARFAQSTIRDHFPAIAAPAAP